jgi:hypothetical protein
MRVHHANRQAQQLAQRAQALADAELRVSAARQVG